jgi:NosR/NirI family transcriptional regulator, nitrite reductase regulator
MLCGAAAAADLGIAKQFFDGPDITVEPPAGTPPSARIMAAGGRLLGYAFSTRDVSGSVGYSGRPLDIVAAVTPDGIIAGASIVAHEEPILVIGVPREALVAYVANFRGYNVAGTVGPAGGRPHGVAGASITSAVIHDAILRSARTVLRLHAAKASASPRLNREDIRRLSWPSLVNADAVRRLSITRGDAARRLGTSDPEPEKPYIDLWLALATPPAIGESLLGQREFETALGKAGAEDDFLLIGASGLYSFRGTEWRRSGVFERIELVQGSKSFRLRAEDYRMIETLHAAGAPELREIGLFRIARDGGFDSTQPFRLDLALTNAIGLATPAATVSLDYRVPDAFLVRSQPETPSVPAPDSATAPADATAAAPLWQDIWWQRRFELAGLCVMLAALGGILIFQNQVTANTRLYRAIRIAFLVTTFVFLGLIAKAQLSVVNVVTFVHALLSGFRWDLFLLDPLVFVLWGFVAVSMLFWGRGVFCGWLCPFGALQELLFKLAKRLGVKQLDVPFPIHERLWMIKYIAFLAILAVSLHSVVDAFLMAEIEPFKTVIVLRFMRDLPFLVYALLLLAAGLFIERFYCRYLCPLGGALAIPARLRMFEWLNRRRECGSECQVCARTCTVQAIHPLGQINPNECIYCLQCQANYFDDTVCLTLMRRAARKTKTTAPGSPS